MTLNDKALELAGKESNLTELEKRGNLRMSQEGEDGMIRPINNGLVTAEGDNISSEQIQEIRDEAKVKKEVTSLIDNLLKHNETVQSSIDPRYSEDIELKPNYYLVRMLVKKVEKKTMTADGSLTDLVTALPYIDIPKKSGPNHGYKRVAASYPYIQVGRLVNVNSEDKFNVGDYVIVREEAVREQSYLGTDQTFVETHFMHPNHMDMTPDETYGYVLLRDHQIIGKVNNFSI